MWRAGAEEARGGWEDQRRSQLIERTALIAWLPVVRDEELVKDRRPPKAAALRAVLDKLFAANKTLSMRSRPLSRPCNISSMQIRNVRHMAERCGRWHNTAPRRCGPMSFLT